MSAQLDESACYSHTHDYLNICFIYEHSQYQLFHVIHFWWHMWMMQLLFFRMESIKLLSSGSLSQSDEKHISCSQLRWSVRINTPCFAIKNIIKNLSLRAPTKSISCTFSGLKFQQGYCLLVENLYRIWLWKEDFSPSNYHFLCWLFWDFVRYNG